MTCGAHAHSDTEATALKIVAFNKQYRVTLPKDLVEDKGWRPGTELRFVEDEHGRIFLKPIEKRGRPDAPGKRDAARDAARTVRGGGHA